MKFLSAIFLVPCLLVSGLSASTRAQTQGDPERGQKIYRRCVACHFVDQDKNRIGPTLKNVMGRKAGTITGFKFSPAMVKAGENGLIWTRETLIQYLHSPQAMVKGTRMASIKITSDQDIDDLIAFIEKKSKE